MILRIKHHYLILSIAMFLCPHSLRYGRALSKARTAFAPAARSSRSQRRHHSARNRDDRFRTRCTTSQSHDLTRNEIQMRRDAEQMIRAAIRAVDPYVAVRDRLSVQPLDAGEGGSTSKAPALVVQTDRDGATLKYNLSDYDSIQIFSFGKASAAMAIAAAEVARRASSLSPVAIGGTVAIKDDHATPDEIETLRRSNISVRAASHPVPDERSVSAAEEMLRSAAEADERTLIVACVSGGGSALFCSPRDPLTLADLARTNSALLASGAPIEKANAVRKRLERGKGGGLAAAAYPATVLTLVLSDIIGDPLDLIASGPTVPDGSGGAEAWEIVEEYGLGEGGDHELPLAVLELLRRGREGTADDTTKPDNPAFSFDESSFRKYTENVLVGNNYASVMAAADQAKRLGYHPIVLGTRVEGEASCVAGMYVAMAEMLTRQRGNNDYKPSYEISPLPVALIAGGETTVTLPPNSKGKGGRNQELALTAAIKMQEIGLRDVVLASVGTDGTDGPTDAAGAIVDGGTTTRIETYISSNPETRHSAPLAKDALRDHDAYNFFSSGNDDSLITTGPTGTNVADICITLVC